MVSAAAFVLLFLTCTVLAFARSPMFGLGLYLAVFYIHPPSRWWGPMLPDLRWSLLAAVVAVLGVVIGGKRLGNGARPWYRTAPGIALLLFTAWFCIQNLWALEPELHRDASIQWIKYIVVFYLVYRLAKGPGETADILLFHVAGCFFLGLLCFYQGRDFGARLDGVGGPGIDDANSLGMYLATGVAVGAMLLLTSKGWRRVALLFALPVILNGLILTGSRGAFLGVVAGGAVLLFLCPPQQRLAFWLCAFAGVVAAATLVDDKFIERMFTIKTAVESTKEVDSSTENRFVLLEAQIKMAVRFPHGAGFRGTAALSREYLDDRWLTESRGNPSELARSSHNVFMTAVVEQGVLGAVLYIWMCLWGWAAVVRLKSLQAHCASPDTTAPAIACCAGLAVLWTAGQFTDYTQTEVQIWLFALLASSLEQLRLSAPQSRADSSEATVLQHSIAATRIT